MVYQPDKKRVTKQCSTVAAAAAVCRLPVISLGLWYNFGDETRLETAVRCYSTLFDLGITHFDLANNYGPPPSSAGKATWAYLQESLLPYRDELIILHESGIYHVGGPLRRLGIAQISTGKS